MSEPSASVARGSGFGLLGVRDLGRAACAPVVPGRGGVVAGVLVRFRGDRLEAGGGELEGQRLLGLFFPSPDGHVLPRPDLLHKAGVQKLGRRLLRCSTSGAGWRNQAMIVALRSGVEQHKLRIGEPDRHGLDPLRGDEAGRSSPLTDASPGSNDPRGRVPRGVLSAVGQAHTRFVSSEKPVLSRVAIPGSFQELQAAFGVFVAVWRTRS